MSSSLSPPGSRHGSASDEERAIDHDPREAMPPRLAPSTALVPGSLVVLALLAGLGVVAYVLYSLIQAQRG
jgi:hypothetical protein